MWPLFLGHLCFSDTNGTAADFGVGRRSVKGRSESGKIVFRDGTVKRFGMLAGLPVPVNFTVTGPFLEVCV